MIEEDNQQKIIKSIIDFYDLAHEFVSAIETFIDKYDDKLVNNSNLYDYIKKHEDVVQNIVEFCNAILVHYNFTLKLEENLSENKKCYFESEIALILQRLYFCKTKLDEMINE